MIAIAFPYLVLTELHYGAFKLGLLYTSAAIASAALALLFGFLTDVWGRRRMLFLAGVLLPLSSGVVVVSSRLDALFIASILGGYSATGSLMTGGIGGAAQPIQNAVVADLTTPETRTSYYSLLTFLSGAFGAVGALLAKFSGVRHIFLAATLISALGLLFLAALRIPNTRGNLRRLQSKYAIVKFTLVGTLNGLSQGLVIPFLIPFFVIVYHVPRSQMGVYAFVGGLMAAVALLAAPRFERRLGFVKSVAVTRGTGAVLLLMLPLTKVFALALIIYLITPTLRVMAVPLQQTALTGMVKQDELGRAMGINQVARLGASSGGIALTGYLFEISEIAVPFGAYAAIMALNIYLYFRFFASALNNDLDEV